MARIELATPSLPRKYSTTELHWHLFSSGRRDSNSRPSAWKADALPTELLPRYLVWGEQDSNLRRHKSADLQSAPVGRFGISPSKNITPQAKCLQFWLANVQLIYFTTNTFCALFHFFHHRDKPPRTEPQKYKRKL